MEVSVTEDKNIGIIIYFAIKQICAITTNEKLHPKTIALFKKVMDAIESGHGDECVKACAKFIKYYNQYKPEP